MGLTVSEIRSGSDMDLAERLTSELRLRFPLKLQKKPERFLAALQAAPRGLRAMAAVYDLDVSMTLDDLAWHFGNHPDERFLKETADGLKELGATEAAKVFCSAWKIVKPFLPEIREGTRIKDFHDYLDTTGIQGRIDPLDARMRKILNRYGDMGLLQYWLAYARKYPERCV